MLTATDVDDRFDLPYTPKRGQDVTGIGTYMTLAGVFLERDPGGDYFLKGPGMTGVSASPAKAASVLNNIEALSYKAHTDCLDDVRFQRLYLFSSGVSLPYMDSWGQTISKPCDVYPCHYCGILVRKDLVQVDHRQPQALDGFAVLKVLRAVDPDLTLRGPSDHVRSKPVVKVIGGFKKPKKYITKPGPVLHYRKSLQTPHILAVDPINPAPATVTQLIPIHPKGWDVTTPWGLGAGTTIKRDRYTLSEEGKLILTMGIMMWGAKAFPEMCLNNLINLVPSCAKCNNSKRNIVHAHK